MKFIKNKIIVPVKNHDKEAVVIVVWIDSNVFDKRLWQRLVGMVLHVKCLGFGISGQLSEIDFIDDVELGEIPDRQHGIAWDENSVGLGKKHELAELRLRELNFLHLFKLVTS